MATPRDPTMRGGHITVRHPDARALVASMWEQGVIPDFREPPRPALNRPFPPAEA